jgi:hypothetical protein
LGVITIELHPPQQKIQGQEDARPKMRKLQHIATQHEQSEESAKVDMILKVENDLILAFELLD